MMLVDDDRALRRALQVERSIRKQYERRLRELMQRDAFEEFRRVCQAESITRCEVQGSAKVTDAERETSFSELVKRLV